MLIRYNNAKYITNNRVSKYLKQKWVDMTRKTYQFLLDFSTPFSGILRIQKNRTTHQTNGQIDIYGTGHSTTAEYSFFSCAHRTFTLIDHIMYHSRNINQFKGMVIIQSCSLIINLSYIYHMIQKLHSAIYSKEI